ncbi:MAG TPA: ABC transporter permease [Terriglobia bacterium]|nr:ABC transporter permease [Terriglobia bacterium]
MDLIRQTWMTLKANKTRSFLTMFGIAWGLICLILMTAIGEGMWVAQKRKAASLGQNIMIVWGGMTSKGGEGVRAGRNIRLTLEDYFTLKSEASYLQRLSPEIERYLPVRSSLNNGSFSIHGIFPDYMQMRTIEVHPDGRVIHEGDNSNAQRVCILGDEVKTQLFDKTNPVGQTISIGGFPYLVIGELVHKDQNSNYSGPDAQMIYVPFYSVAKDFPIPDASEGKFQISNLILQPKSESLGEAAELQVRAILAKYKDFDYLDKDALPIWNTITGAKFIHKLFSSMRVFLGTVAVVTLILGGIGIMNIMLLTVQERTREIGVRKSIGATSRDILLQFFAEAMTLTFSAGLVGIGVGWGICALFNLLPKIDFFAGLIVTPEIGLMAFGFLILVGVLSGIYPAFMASLINPIEALRYE